MRKRHEVGQKVAKKQGKSKANQIFWQHLDSEWLQAHYNKLLCGRIDGFECL